MPVEVVAYRAEWPGHFRRVADALRRALAAVPSATVEHVGSTSVPGLAAKPVIDVDVVVADSDVPAAIAALEAVGYVHQGDLGIVGREALRAPDDDPRRHVYVCAAGGLALRNHLAVRDVLRRRDDLRDQYAAVKRALAAQPGTDIDTYTRGKTAVLQRVLAESPMLSDAERRAVAAINRTPPGPRS